MKNRSLQNYRDYRGGDVVRTEGRRHTRFAILTLFTLACLSAMTATAGSAFAQSSSFAAAYPQASAKEYLGPVGDSIRPYRPAGRDPFKKIVKPKPKPGVAGTAREPKPLGFPSLEERRAKFRQIVDESGSRGLPEPNPVLQYLVSELEITGVFRDQSGYGAFVRAAPTGTTFFIRRGARCYNGEVLRIESDTSNSGSKVTFRQESYIDVNGKQVKQENLVSKAPAVGTKPH